MEGAAELDVPEDPEDLMGEQQIAAQSIARASARGRPVPVIDVVTTEPTARRPVIDVGHVTSGVEGGPTSGTNGLLRTTGQLSGLMSTDSLEVSSAIRYRDHENQHDLGLSNSKNTVEMKRKRNEHAHAADRDATELQDDAASLLQAGFASPSVHTTKGHGAAETATPDLQVESVDDVRASGVATPAAARASRRDLSHEVGSADAADTDGASTRSHANSSGSYSSDGFDADLTAAPKLKASASDGIASSESGAAVDHASNEDDTDGEYSDEDFEEDGDAEPRGTGGGGRGGLGKTRTLSSGTA